MLHEKYRPQSFDEIVGQDRAVKAIKRQIDRGGFAGRAVWLAGLSGTGKTTIAKLIAREVADENDIQQIVGRKLTDEHLKSLLTFGGMFGGEGSKRGRALIIDESHGLRADIIEVLLGKLERDGMPSHAVIIFTTRVDPSSFFERKEDGRALISRCLQPKLTSKGLDQAFAIRAKEIAETEGLADESLPLETYVKLVRRCECNMRDVLCQIESGELLDSADSVADAASYVPASAATVSDSMKTLDSFLRSA